MSNQKIKFLSFPQRFFSLLLIVFLAVSLFSACGSADATTKKEKSKKSKTKKSSPAKEDEETSAETDSENSEEKTKETEKEDKKSVSKTKKTSLKPSEKNSEAEAVWNDLMKGNKRFSSGRHTSSNYSKSRIGLVKGQQPQAIILGCSDSRVPPELVFDKNLGELFVIRNAGNIVDKVSLGSIEYAVEHLHAKVLLVLGHESCGAVTATVSGEKMPTPNLRAITETIAPAFEDSADCKIGGKMNMACVELSARHTSKAALLKSPIIKKAVEKGELTIISAVYRLESGEIVRLD